MIISVFVSLYIFSDNNGMVINAMQSNDNKKASKI